MNKTMLKYLKFFETTKRQTKITLQAIIFTMPMNDKCYGENNRWICSFWKFSRLKVK